VDADFVAVEPAHGGELVLVNRQAIALLRALV
jgi:hypothetical protein